MSHRGDFELLNNVESPHIVTCNFLSNCRVGCLQLAHVACILILMKTLWALRNDDVRRRSHQWGCLLDDPLREEVLTLTSAVPRVSSLHWVLRAPAQCIPSATTTGDLHICPLSSSSICGGYRYHHHYVGDHLWVEDQEKEKAESYWQGS